MEVIHKMKRGENIKAVRIEQRARVIGYNFDDKATWTNLINLLKIDEGDQQYLRPHIAYDSFKWLPYHYI